MFKLLIIPALLLLPAFVEAAAITTGTDEQAKLPYWNYQDEGMSFRFVQRLPDQTRGYFLARGFSSEHAEIIAQGCVFQTIISNISNKGKPAVASYQVQDWRVIYQGKDVAMKSRVDWDSQWQQLNVAAPARLAFTWSVLADRQEYQPGDYNWGMAVFNLAPGSPFSLKLVWQQHGEQRSVIIPGMECAADIHTDPEAQ